MARLVLYIALDFDNYDLHLIHRYAVPLSPRRRQPLFVASKDEPPFPLSGKSTSRGRLERKMGSLPRGEGCREKVYLKGGWEEKSKIIFLLSSSFKRETKVFPLFEAKESSRVIPFVSNSVTMS